MPEIKDWLVAACGTLTSGEVVKPVTLTYLDAMNALEMNEPGMDAGASFDPLGAFDPAACLSVSEIIWIMDEMAAREVAWLRGWNMAQTVFTSLHYHNAYELRVGVNSTHPDFVDQEAGCAALRAFLLCYSKSVEIVHSVLMGTNGPARDGEDVWLDSYGIPLDTSESVHQVAALVTQMVAWLERQGDKWAPAVARIKFRRAWIDLLLCDPSPLPPREAFTPSSTPVPWAFDNVTPFLRQNMPYPSVTIPSHEETWDTLFTAARQIQSMKPMSLAQTEMFLRGKADTMLPIVRCLYKTTLCDDNVDGMVDQWLVAATRLPPGILSRMDAEIPQRSRSAFVLWRDIIGGTLHLNLTAHLSNSARQRRSFLHLSESWQKQAVQASRFPGATPLIPALRSRALDCALLGHLLGFPLNVFSKGEMRAAWWVVLVLSRARGGDSWEAKLARAWGAVAAANVLLYSLIPGEMSTAQFLLRHKILHASVGISPGAWDRARVALDEATTDVSATLKLARTWLVSAEEKFAALSPDLDVTIIQRDITKNVATLGSEVDKVKLKMGPSGYIPLLE